MKFTLILISFMLLALIACNNGPKEAENEKEISQKETSEGTENTIKKETQKIPSEYLISSSQAGKFKIGDNIPFPETADTYRIGKVQQERTTEEGPIEETIYTVTENGIDTLILKPQYDHNQGAYNNKIGEIIVLSEKYRTKEGIGVNTTVAEFQKTYPDFKMWYTYVSGRYVIEAAKLSVQFILNEKDFIGKMNVNSAKVSLKEGDFKAGSKIVKVRVYK